MSSSLDVGDVVRLAATFTDVSGSPAIPATVVCRIQNGSASEVATYVFGSGTLVATGSGAYQVDHLIDSPGQWRYRFQGSGSHQAAEEFTFHVRESAFS
jgi:hypothetical protein